MIDFLAGLRAERERRMVLRVAEIERGRLACHQAEQTSATMLAAISTTILSNRSWAETCSAMVSRSRLSKTRGPPDALRMCWYPPPRSQHPGWPAAGGKFKKSNNFSHSAPPQTSKPAESAWLKLSHSLRQPPHQAV